MKSLDEIALDVKHILKANWKRERKIVVPEAKDIGLGNVAGEIEGAVLYADIKGSTDLVYGYKDYFAAEIYKSFLSAACSVIRNNDGVITSFDGDRVMAIFAGNCKCSNAAKAALQMFSVAKRINAEIRCAYPSTDYRIAYAVGVDVGNLFTIRTGIRGDNDLAWIGDSANVAAKLSEIRCRAGNAFITGRVFSRLNDASKYSSAEKSLCMWNLLPDVVVCGQVVYESTWFWNF